MRRNDYMNDPISALVAETIEAIDLLVERELWVQALSLLYSAIDSMAWLDLAETAENTGRAEYTAWVQRYLIPDSGLTCTADDVYSARCGLLHSGVAGSIRAERERNARELHYDLGSGHQMATVRWRKDGDPDPIRVSPRDLVTAFSRGAERYRDEVLADEQRKQRVHGRSWRWLHIIRRGDPVWKF